MGWFPARNPNDPFERGSVHLFNAHFFLAALWCGTVLGSLSVAEVTSILLYGIAALRLPWTWRAWVQLLGAPLTWLLFLTIFSSAITLVWTPDLATGSHHWFISRFGLALFALYPLRRFRLLFILLLLVGLALSLVSMPLNWLGNRHGVEWLALRRTNSLTRNGGWWPEVIGGQMLVLAVGLLLPGLLRGQQLIRTCSAVAMLLVFVGIWATGTRAAFLAAPAVILLAMLVAIRRLDRSWSRGTVTFALIGGLLSVGALGWFAGGEGLRSRITQGVSEVRRAWTSQDYNSDTGLRIWMAQWGLRAWAEHPIRGVGLGGYRAWVLKRAPHPPAPGSDATDRFDVSRHTHAHNALIHAAATTGTLGAALWIATTIAGLIAAARWIPRARTDPSPPEHPCAVFHEGPFWALVGLVLLVPFDSLHASASMFAAMTALWALCPPIPSSGIGMNLGWRLREPLRTSTSQPSSPAS